MQPDVKSDNMSEDASRLTVAISKRSDQETNQPNNKILRRLAQNREAARKSRLRKKAYVQQLESSRIRLKQIEQELERIKQQGLSSVGHGGDHLNGSGAVLFDLEYGRWAEEQNRQIRELRSALQAHVSDMELQILVENNIAHYDELFRIKGNAAKSDVFHLMSGMWRTPAERCFMWMGGFRPSELLKILSPHLEPLAENQSRGVSSLKLSSQQAEDALSQGMEALQQSLADTLSVGSIGSPNVANYMGQMASAMGKLGMLENLVRQADNLRQQALQQMQRILTTRQAARGLLVMGEYFNRLRALSSLWAARPRE